MSAEPPSPERLAEVSRLCTQLADHALDALIMGRPVPPEQIAALVKAGRLLQDHGVEWPPLLAQVIHDLAKNAADPESDPAPSQALAEAVRGGLSRFFAKPRVEADQS